LAKFLLTYGGDRMDLVLLPGRFSQAGEFATSYWLPDLAGIRRVAATHFGLEAEVTPIPPQHLAHSRAKRYRQAGDGPPHGARTG
jgi:hypothetical protein